MMLLHLRSPILSQGDLLALQNYVVPLVRPRRQLQLYKLYKDLTLCIGRNSNSFEGTPQYKYV